MGCGSSKRVGQVKPKKAIPANRGDSQPGRNESTSSRNPQKVQPHTQNPPAGHANQGQDEAHNTQLAHKVLALNSFADHYELLEKIAILPYGQIRRCIHRGSNLKRLVKIVKQEPGDETFSSERYITREVKTISSLDHPNIVNTFDILFDTQYYYVVMEDCGGGRLFDVLDKMQGLTEAQIAHIIEQLLSAINYAHQRRVIHRDLSPSVVFLVDDSLWLKVAELGSSAFIDVEHKHEGRLENQCYVAPEVADGYYNEKCDLWSVGMIAYILFAGKPPVLPDVDINQLSEYGASSKATDLIGQLLQKDFIIRPSASQALTHDWIKGYKSENLPQEKVLSESMNNLKKFNQASGLKGALRSFISSQILTNTEVKNMHDTFKALDANSDGKLTRTEMMAYYSRRMSQNEASELVAQIMEKVDTDHSGKIEYSEFIQASVQQQKLISRQNLQAAFKMLDKDASGTLCISELQGLFEGLTSSKNCNWSELIKDADRNGDGQIDIGEFSDLLLSKIN